MLLYINGDSHCVGHGIVEEYGMSHEDLTYSQIKQAPHPINFPHSFGYQLANKLNLPLVCQASSGSSIERALRTSKQFVFQTNQKIIIILGLPSLNREEWYFQNKWWQITEGDKNRYPPELHSRFQNWLLVYDSNDYKQTRRLAVEKKINDFSMWLDNINIKHLFFTTVDNIGSYENYSIYLKSKNINPDKWNHFKLDGHTAWADYIIQKIV